MAFTAKDVLARTSTILSDAGGKRWLFTELLDWLNDAMREINVKAPHAVAKSVVLTLVSGTRQTLDPAYSAMLRVNCNVTAVGQVVSARGNTITPITRDILDAQIPGWQNTTSLPYQAEVAHLIDDPALPREFFIAPGNTGTGKIEAVCAERPAIIPSPANPLVLANYTTTVVLDDMYLNAVVDYVLSRAFSKDIQVPGAAQRAMAHYQQFATSFGIDVQNEATINPNTRNGA
jgi:hypothetical protein